jgi:hypothetical protein
VGAGACGSDSDSSNETDSAHGKLTDDEVDALCKDKVSSAVDKAQSDQDLTKVCSDMVADAKKAAPSDTELPKLCEAMVSSAKSDADKASSDLKSKITSLEGELAKANDQVKSLKEKARPLLLTADEKTTSSEQKEYTFAELTSMCDKRSGYTQIHGACGGHNACAGFSYGDWGPGAATLTEHTCTGVNGCNGLSCVVLPKDSGKTGKQIYETEKMFPEPFGDCGGCHGGHYDDANKWVKDLSYFALFLAPGSTRTAQNWLDRPAREQELLTAFGSRGLLANGIAYEHMAEYHTVLSRAETERVVAHIRTLKPYIHTFKTVDK